MIQSLPYTCRLCNTNHVAKYDDECPGMQLEKWKKLLVCNRCADYLEAKRKLSESIAHVCRMLQVAGAYGQPPPAEMLDRSRIKLERLTSQFAEVVSAYHHKQKVWEQQFVEMLIAKPNNPGAVLREYERWMKKA